MKFQGSLDISGVGSYAINPAVDYASKAAMVVDTMMNAALECLRHAETQLRIANSSAGVHKAELTHGYATGIAYRLWLWRTYGAPVDGMAGSWLDDAICTINANDTFDSKEAKNLFEYYEREGC